MDLITVIIALSALVVSLVSLHFSRKAFALSLFDKRYKLFREFKSLVDELIPIEKDVLQKYLGKIKSLLVEAQYIFDEDIFNLLNQIKENIIGTNLYFARANDMADGGQPEDYGKISQLKRQHYDQLNSKLEKLLSDDKLANLNSYFNKYLADKDFRRPLNRCFLKVF